MAALFYALVVLAGLSIPVQSAANSALNKGLGQTAMALLVIYGVAVLGLLACMPFLGLALGNVTHRASAMPWWAYVGGLCNLLFVLAAATTTQKIGSAAFTVTTLVAAIILSIVLDHFGLLGLEKHPASLVRVAGVVLSIGGVALVLLF